MKIFRNLGELEERGLIKLGRGNVISKRDIAATPGGFPIYSSAREKNGTFGYYGKHMFNEEMITWSIDGGGRFFYREKHKFSVTNVGGTLKVLDKSALDIRYLYFVLTSLHSRIAFDWVFKAHPSVIRKVYEYIPLPSLQEQNAIVEKLDAAFVSLAEMESSLRAETKLLLEVLDSQHRTHFFENGNNWPVSTIGELCEYQNGKAHEQLVTVNGKFRLVTSKFVSTDGTQARRVSRALSPLSRGDVAFVLSDLPNGKALAKAFLVTEEEDLTLNQRVLRIRSKDLDPKFLYLQVNRNPHLLAFDNGESQTHLKLAQALSCPLLVPDMKIQTEISEHFFVLRASIHESLSVQELKLARIKELREAILSSFLCEESNVA